jgi:transcriptional regulator with XRE-family HTH domain
VSAAAATLRDDDRVTALSRMIGSAVKRRREALNVPVKDFAMLMGVAPSMLLALENGRRNWSSSSIEGAGRALRVAPWVLLMPDDAIACWRCKGSPDPLTACLVCGKQGRA